MPNIFEKYRNKKILVTGHTGFKGSWLITWLLSLGAEVHGISNDILTEPSNFKTLKLGNNFHDNRIDILDFETLENKVNEIRPHIIFHLAAESLVKKSFNNPRKAFSTNAIGSINLLEIIRNLKEESPALVMITSDKVYKNNEWIWGYRENDIIGGDDPYSASKGMAELAINSFIKSYFSDSPFYRIAVARAGNVIGGGDWSEDRLIPDCMKAWSQNKKVVIRSPNSTRPWQHVLEPLSGYLLLGLKLLTEKNINYEKYNFGPSQENDYSVIDVITEMSKYWSNIEYQVNEKHRDIKESVLLKLNCEKALKDLGWSPSLSFEDTIRLTVDWYKFFYNKEEIFEITKQQINFYQDIISKKYKYENN